MEFLKERKEGMLFPYPKDGETVLISPPGFAWLPAENASSYRIVVRSIKGDKIYEKEVGSDPEHLPDEVFKSGEYTWDVIAIDKNEREIDRGEKSFSIVKNCKKLPWIDPKKLLLRAPSSHPKLLYLQKELPAIRETLNTTRKQAWTQCVEAADRALKTPAPQYPTYQKLKDPTASRLEYKNYYRELTKYLDEALIDLSIAYLITTDAKYAKAAKRILMEIVSWPTDDADVTSVSSKWGDEPGLHIAKCLHRAYDWLYDSLDKNERAVVLQACESRAWQIYRRLKDRQNFLTYPGESHAGRLIAYLAEMAIVMAGETTGAEEWLEYSLRALLTIYPHWGGSDGGWAEGIDYGKDYNSIYIPAFEGLRIACNYNLWKRPFFENIRKFFFYCSTPTAEIQPFGDGSDRPGPGVDGQKIASLVSYHAHLYEDPYAEWWARKISSYKGIKGELALIFEDGFSAKKPADLQNSRSFPEIGWAGLHSDISDPDNDTFLLFKSSPYGSVSHSHADQNSFAIMKGGKALAIPSGYYGPLYGTQHHAEWTRSTKANNCVLVNGEGQIIRSSKSNGHMVDFLDDNEFTYVHGDALPAYEGKLLRSDRHILYLRPGVFLMLDDLQAPDDSKYQWMLHALEKMKIVGSNQIRSQRKGAILDVYLSCPQGLSITQTDQFDTPYNAGIPEQFHKDVPNQWHITAETTIKSKASRIGAVMIVSDSKELYEVKTLAHKGWYGVQVRGNFGEVEGWVQTLPNSSGPSDFDDKVTSGKAIICGRATDNKVFSR